MIVLAWVLLLPSGPAWPAYPDFAECMKTAAKYQGSTCEQRKIFAIPPTISFEKK